MLNLIISPKVECKNKESIGYSNIYHIGIAMTSLLFDMVGHVMILDLSHMNLI